MRSNNLQCSAPGIHSHACERKHGTVVELLALIPDQDVSKARGDPFITMSGRPPRRGWPCLRMRRHGAWQPRRIDPLRPELSEGELELTAHWTVHALGYAMGANRDTAGKAMKELMEGGWVRREDPRNKGQFGGIDYTLVVPNAVTQADRYKVAAGLKKRGIEYRGYEHRLATRVLEDEEIRRVRSDVDLEIEMEQADMAGEEEKAVTLASQYVLRRRAGEEPSTGEKVTKLTIEASPWRRILSPKKS